MGSVKGQRAGSSPSPNDVNSQTGVKTTRLAMANAIQVLEA
jgi:hypothetical protein